MKLWNQNCTRHSLSVLSIQSLVNLIKQVKRSWVTFLNGKNQSKSYQGFLSTRKLLHFSHFTLFSCKWHLRKYLIRVTISKGVKLPSSLKIKLHTVYQFKTCKISTMIMLSGKLNIKLFYPNSNSSELVNWWNTALWSRAPLTFTTPFSFILRLTAFHISFLHHQSSFATRDQLLEYFTKVFGYLKMNNI